MNHDLQADHTQTKDMCEKLRDAALRLRSLASDMGASVTVKELHSERCHNLLAAFTKKHLEKGAKSNATAEVMARSDPEYGVKFEELAEQLREANQIVFRYKTEDKVVEAARSLLSASKRIENDLMG